MNTHSRCSQSALQSGATYEPWPQIVPTSWPPMDCHTFCPSRIASPTKSTRPSEVTTSDGIGGALLSTLIPTPPRTAKEMVSTSPRAIHSFRYDMDDSFPRREITMLFLLVRHFTITWPFIQG